MTLTVQVQDLPRAQQKNATSWWSPVILICIWLVLHLGCMFTPGLLDDVDSIYIEVAREMTVRHDYVTPYIDGVRFFDKPPLLYWMAAGSMKILGPYDWAARLPLSLCVLGLFFAVYALGKRLFDERGGFYAALVMATSVGPYLFTRFYIPDILNALWMTLGVHLYLIALDRVRQRQSTWLPALGFSVTMALNLLTKGLIGVVFPIGFVVLYGAFTRQTGAVRRMHLAASTALFAAVALPWHVLAALRNPPIALPAGNGLPARAGWFWFYIINEHFLRFRGLRIPHDYGQVPVLLFWFMFFAWLMPWSVFLPAAFARYWELWRTRSHAAREKRAALTLLLWSGMVLLFFTLSSRQEYYSLPALPALALMAGGVLAAAEAGDPVLRRGVLRASTWFLLPVSLVIGVVCGTLGVLAPSAPPGADISQLLTSNPDQYNLALGHLHDLTTGAMGFFRLPLLGVAVSMMGLGPIAWFLRRRKSGTGERAANMVLVLSMCGVLLCVHSGLARFYPILGSKELGLKIASALQPGDRVMLDGKLTDGSTLLFYTRQPLIMVNARIYNVWFGSFWPDCPDVLTDDTGLRQRWAGTDRIFLMTAQPGRIDDLQRFAPVHLFAASGGKLILTNR